MAPPPLTDFLGFAPLPSAVLVAFILTIGRAALFLCSFSSAKAVNVGGVQLAPVSQVALAAAALAGVPIAVLAGFGIVFRMEKHVRLFYRWLTLTLLLDIYSAAQVVLSGRVCTAVTWSYLLRQGPMFVCLFIGMGALFWLTVFVLFEAYIAYAVWSQAELLLRDEYAELMRYGSHSAAHVQGLLAQERGRRPGQHAPPQFQG
mmetsp:Transcript_43465/g.138370  ORF Transcript_43465/g.138370 Transcript_43465/m.138370 type:complete len:203 (-) Transcript_43465:83-691(-)